MTDLKWCPECRDDWVKGRKQCDCGYRIPEKGSFTNPRHGLCAYSSSGQYCPLPGSTSDSTRNTADTPFYCRFHATTHGDQKVADQLLQQIIRKEVGISKVDWRDALMEEMIGRRRAA